MAFSWLAVDAVDGHVWGELADFTIDKARAVLGQVQTAQGTYPVASDTTPVDFLQGTVPWAIAILLISDMAPNPVGGWYVNQRVRTLADLMSLPLVSGEGILERRIVGNATFTGTDQNTILSSLVTSFLSAPPTGSTGLSGWPGRVNVVGGAGKVRDRTYLDINDQTLLTAAQELMGVIGGPEFTVTWEHLTSPERYLPVLNVGTRIGTAVTAGLGPQAVFEVGGTSTGGSVTDVTYAEDYSTGKGANFVTATGVTQADGSRPQRSVSTADTRRLAVEHRWNPSTTITDPATLLAHAQSQAILMANGARSLTLSSIASQGPIFGVDWFLGDDIGYSVGGQDQNAHETVPGFPGSLSGIARAIGWEMQPDIPTNIVTPILGSV
jgi:hypothetical protein